MRNLKLEVVFAFWRRKLYNIYNILYRTAVSNWNYSNFSWRILIYTQISVVFLLRNLIF
nr:MAG TPA: hypothetical protein [Caudoviricetes sp.]